MGPFFPWLIGDPPEKAMSRVSSNLLNAMSRVWIKQTAVLFTLVYLFSTGLIMVRAEGHALSHEEHEDHAKRHASFICAWMCAASTFVHTPEQTLDQRSTPYFENPIAKPEVPPRPQPLSADTIRPPPFLLS
ncbi:MAG: hypothetical protein EPO39_11950 [Candidatus Manganitrophaceae bacterium]|nr:MAG: hypothetical protein EPO39_11950 [Candidatus Manganitrophaceae bacterium]